MLGINFILIIFAIRNKLTLLYYLGFLLIEQLALNTLGFMQNFGYTILKRPNV